MKKPNKSTVTTEYFLDWWLDKYHNTNPEKVLEDHPEWAEAIEAGKFDSREFYEAYPVTKEQHDEWHEWAISEVMRIFGYSKKRARQIFAFTYLNCAPNYGMEDSQNKE